MLLLNFKTKKLEFMMNNINTNNPSPSYNNSDSEQYWRQNYVDRPYYSDFQKEIPDLDYDRDLSSAYALGSRARAESGQDARFEDQETGLRSKWEEFKAESRLKWEHAKHAVKDAWDRM